MTRHRMTVESIYAAFGRGDVPAILDALREDVEWEHDCADHGIPWLAPRRGKAQVGDFFEALRALEIAVRATGRSFQDVELHLWTFDPHGKVARFRHVVDTHQHWLAMRS